MTEIEHILWLKNQFERAGDGFIRTNLGKLLKEHLTKLGYWKNRERGDPKKGYKNSPEAQNHRF